MEPAHKTHTGNSSSSSSSTESADNGTLDCWEEDVFDRFFARDVRHDDAWLQEGLEKTNITRSFCLQPPRSQLVILCHIEEFFTLCHPLTHEQTVDALRRYVKHLRLEERIENFYRRGYPSDTRPCDAHPEDVRELLCTCLGIFSFCRNIVVDYFLSLRPPVLFYYIVMTRGDALTERDFYALKNNYSLDEYKVFLEYRVTYIVKKGLVDLIEHMIEKRIPIHEGMLGVAVKQGQIDVFDRLILRADCPNINREPSYSDYGNLMHHVITKKNDAMFDRLIMHGFDINIRHEKYSLGYPLEYAIFRCDTHFTTRLLDCGAKVDFEPLYEITLLNLAIVNEMPASLIERLITMGLDPREEDKIYGNTQDVIDNLLNGNLLPRSITYADIGWKGKILRDERGAGYNNRDNLFATMNVIRKLCGEIQGTERGRKRPLPSEEVSSPVGSYNYAERCLRRGPRDSMMDEIEESYTDYTAGEDYLSVQYRPDHRLGTGEPFDGYYTQEEIVRGRRLFYPMDGTSNESGSRIALTPDTMVAPRYRYDDDLLEEEVEWEDDEPE